MPNEPVRVISDREQEFQGRRYSQGKEKYYHCGRTRLHRAVWKYHNGQVKQGHEIHHKDCNVANNQIENLQEIPISDHRKFHAATDKALGLARQNVKKAIKAAVRWHSSKAGHEWHKQQFQKIKDKLLAPKAIECQNCGVGAVVGNTGKYCSSRCRQAAYRKDGRFNVPKVCQICGATYQANKYRPMQTCSAKCGHKLQAQKMRKR